MVFSTEYPPELQLFQVSAYQTLGSQPACRLTEYRDQKSSSEFCVFPCDHLMPVYECNREVSK